MALGAHERCAPLVDTTGNDVGGGDSYRYGGSFVLTRAREAPRSGDRNRPGNVRAISLLLAVIAFSLATCRRGVRRKSTRWRRYVTNEGLLSDMLLACRSDAMRIFSRVRQAKAYRTCDEIESERQASISTCDEDLREYMTS